MKNLVGKLVKILNDVEGSVNKSGYNSHQKYKYVMEADLIEAVRKELATQGIFVFSSVENVTKEDKLTTVTTKHTFFDSESGESFDVQSAGQGSDGQDKGIYKAITGAYKYFLMKNFMMAGDDDPENDVKSAAPTYKKPTASKPNPKANTTSAPVKKEKKSGGFSKPATKKPELKAVGESPIGGSLDDIPF